MRSLVLAAVLFVAGLAAQPAPGTGNITGHVFNSLTRAPIRKASVRLTVRQGPISLTAATDAEGKFEFTALPPGRYILSASHGGFDDASRPTPVSLGPEGHASDATIRLRPLSIITGHVVDEDGDPVGRGQVVLFKLTYRDGRKKWVVYGSSPTNDGGEYRMPDLKPGRYLLRAVDLRPPVDNRYGGASAMFSVPAYYPNAVSQQQASAVDVRAGADIGGIDIHLEGRPAR